MSLGSYSDYKPTSTASLGSVPSHWSVIRLGMLESSGNDFVSGPFGSSLGSDDYIESGVPVIRGLNTTLRAEARFVADGFVYVSDEKFSDLSRCDAEPGDLVFTARGTVGKVGIVPADIKRALISPNQLRLRPSHEELHADYLYYVFSSASLFSEISLLSDGVAQPNLNLGNLKSLRVPLPPLDEQKAISSFLDGETSKIDSLVSEQRRLIELLNEKRQAVISHAVTKGLNPNAPMKPSGIQWLGDVPQHWDVKRYKHVLRIQQGMAFKSSDYVGESSVVSVRMGNIKKGGLIDLLHNAKYLPDGFAKEYADYQLNEGDLLIAMTDMSPSLEFLAVPAFMNNLETDRVYLLNQRVGKVVASDSCDSGYLKYLLLSESLREQLKATGLGTVQANMSNGDLYSTSLAIPPAKEEQAEIASYLDNVTLKFERLVAEAERAIELLQERRTALISAAVTGKIDVRKIAYQEAV